MNLQHIKNKIPEKFYNILEQEKIQELRPAQEKAIHAGLLNNQNLLICTPTASGKTLVAELAGVSNILLGRGKTVYIVPLKALASEKHKEFQRKYGQLIKIAISIGDIDKADTYLG